MLIAFLFLFFQSFTMEKESGNIPEKNENKQFTSSNDTLPPPPPPPAKLPLQIRIESKIDSLQNVRIEKMHLLQKDLHSCSCLNKEQMAVLQYKVENLGRMIDHVLVRPKAGEKGYLAVSDCVSKQLERKNYEFGEMKYISSARMGKAAYLMYTLLIRCNDN